MEALMLEALAMAVAGASRGPSFSASNTEPEERAEIIVLLPWIS